MVSLSDASRRNILSILWISSTVIRPISMNQTRCYGELGCFSTGGAFSDIRAKRLISVLPWDRSRINTAFHLYTHRNPSKADTLMYNAVSESSLKRSNFDPALPVVAYSHGYLTFNTDEAIIKAIKDQFIEHRNCNFFVVDWSKGSLNGYWTSTANTRIVGAEIALLLQKLIKYFNVDKSRIQLIGHSLGGQIIGYAGQRVSGLHRLVALDPADPFFQGGSPEIRVDPTDGDMVEAWHTDGRTFLPNPITGLGMWDPVGHFDLYINGGISQPTCGTLKPVRVVFSTIGARNIYQLGRELIACHHLYVLRLLAGVYFSTPTCLPVAYQCSNYSEFLQGKCADCGEDTSRCVVVGDRGEDYRRFKDSHSWPRMFFLRAHWEPPYCMHHYELIVYLEEEEENETVPRGGKLNVVIEDQKGRRSSGVELTFESTLVRDGHVSWLLAVPSTVSSGVATLHLRWENSVKPLILGRGPQGPVSLFYMNVIIPSSEKPQRIRGFCGTNNTMVPYMDSKFTPCDRH